MIVTVYVPVAVDDVVEIVRVELPDPPGTLVMERETRGPVLGETLAARLTVPAKPLIAATEIVEAPFAPGMMATDAGLAVNVKSGVLTPT